MGTTSRAQASPRALTTMLSRWIWYQIDGQAREMDLVLDPTAPLDRLAGTS